MSDKTEAYVQLSADGTGKKVRNLQLDVVQADGTIATVLMQVVSIVDNEGRSVDFSAQAESITLLRQLLVEMRALRRMYGRATSQGVVGLEGGVWDDIAG